MESYITKIRFINTFKEKNISLFTLSDLSKIFTFKNANTVKHLIRRLAKEKIIEKLARNRYCFLHAKKEVSDFVIANFLVFPSYISLETALSYYGILSQFPYQITSITILKPRKVTVRNKIFSYAKVKNEYFKDFIKIDDFLIAGREKAMFDYMYFIYKGLRTSGNISEIAHFLNEKNTVKYINENADPLFKRFLKKYVKL